MPFHDLEKENLEKKTIDYKKKTSFNSAELTNDIAYLFHSLLVRKEREKSLEALIYKLAEAVGVDLDNLEEK